MSQVSFAKKVGIDRSTLCRIVNGRRVPTTTELGWIAKGLGMTMDELMAGVHLPEEVVRGIAEIEAMTERALAAEQERDALRAELEQLKANIVETEAMTERALAAEQERDALRAELEQLEASMETERATVRKERVETVERHQAEFVVLRASLYEIQQAERAETEAREGAAFEQLQAVVDENLQLKGEMAELRSALQATTSKAVQLRDQVSGGLAASIGVALGVGLLGFAVGASTTRH